MKKVVIISTSIRANSNSEAMAKSFAEGLWQQEIKWIS